MKNLFLLLFSFITTTKREVKRARSFEEFRAVATMLCGNNRYGWNNRLEKKYAEDLIIQTVNSKLHVEEIMEIAKMLEGADSRTGGALVETYIHKKIVHAEDLPHLLGLQVNSYSRESIIQLAKIVEGMVNRVGHGDLLVLAKVFISSGPRFGYNSSVRDDLFDSDSVKKMTDNLATSVRFMDSNEIEKCLEIVSGWNTPTYIKRRLSKALAREKRVPSFDDAMEILSNLLWNEDLADRNTVMDEVTILAREEVKSLSHAHKMIKEIDRKTDKKSYLEMKNIFIARAISLDSESEPLSLSDMALLIIHAEWPDDILLKDILRSFLKMARLQKVTANDAVIMASKFSSEDTRYVFLCLYVGEIWEPNFDEALLLWGSYKDVDDFPKDDTDALIFSALEVSNVELGIRELIQTQVWGAGRGDSKRIPQVMIDKVEAFIREVVEESNALSA